MMLTLKRRNWDGPSYRRIIGSKTIIVLTVSVFSILFLLYRTMIDHHRYDPKTQPQQNYLQSILPSEAAFKLTLKSCIPDMTDSKCLQHTPTGSTAKQRIAVLSPHHTSRHLFYNWIKNLLLLLYDQDEQKMNQDIELISTSHVPPYGYGETHGYTKIIRLIHFPLSEHLFYCMNSSSSLSSITTMEDLAQITRQVIRWHCRLSHVAAHTALFTFNINNDDIHSSSSSSSSSWTRLLLFILSSPNKDTTHHHHLLLVERLEHGGPLHDQILQQNKLLFQSIHDQASHVIMTQPLIDTMEHAVADELAKTNNLQTWPCLSFWDVPEMLSVTSRKMAQDLTPTCSAPFTTCSVKKDLCEEKRDPICSS